MQSIAFAVECAKAEVPVVANGDAWSFADSENIRTVTKAQGVMSARGLLANPALFAGYEKTPLEAIKEFVHLSADYGLIFPLFHKHLSYMLESHHTRMERNYFNTLISYAGVIEELEREV